MKKKGWILCGVVLAAVMVLWLVYLFSYKTVFETKFEKTLLVKDSVVTPEKIVFDFELEKAGKYYIQIDNSLEPKGLMENFRLMWKGKGEVVYNEFTYYNIEGRKGYTNAFFMRAGEHCLEIDFVASEREWRELLATWGLPLKDSGYEFAENGEFELQYDFKLIKVPDGTGLPIILVQILAILLVLLLNYGVGRKGDVIGNVRDERQSLLVGRGWKYTFYTMSVLTLLYVLCKMAGIDLPMERGVPEFIIMIAGILVMNLYCVRQDVFFAMNQRIAVGFCIYLVMALMQLYFAVTAFRQHQIIQEGILTAHSKTLFSCISFFMIIGAILGKWIFKEREAD